MNAPHDEQAIEDANERACRAAAAANGLSQDKADSCEDAERNCPGCPFRRAAQHTPGLLTDVDAAALTRIAAAVSEPHGTALCSIAGRISRSVTAHDELVAVLRDEEQACAVLEARNDTPPHIATWARDRAAKLRAAIAKAAGGVSGCPLGCTATSNCKALRDGQGSECQATPFQLAHGDAA